MAATHARFRLPMLGALALLCAAAPAFAASGTQAPAPADAARPDPMCAAFGKDFVRVAGSSTCIRVSGQVQGDVYQNSSRMTGDALAPALRSK